MWNDEYSVLIKGRTCQRGRQSRLITALEAQGIYTLTTTAVAGDLNGTF